MEHLVLTSCMEMLEREDLETWLYYRRLSGWLVVVSRFGFMLFQLSTISSPKACDTILASPWTADLLVLHWNALRNRPFDISTFVVSIRHIHRTPKISSIRGMY